MNWFRVGSCPSSNKTYGGIRSFRKIAKPISLGRKKTGNNHGKHRLLSPFRKTLSLERHVVGSSFPPPLLSPDSVVTFPMSHYLLYLCWCWQMPWPISTSSWILFCCLELRDVAIEIMLSQKRYRKGFTIQRIPTVFPVQG